MYPSDELISRLWTVYCFLKEVLPLLVNCSQLTEDITAFLAPKIAECATFQCEMAEPGESNLELVEFLIRKFVSPLIHNQCQIDEQMEGLKTKNFVTPQNKVLRMRTLSKE